MVDSHREVDLFTAVEITVPIHRGVLTPREVGLGVLAAHRNARRLFLDALVLLESNRIPGAVSMAILAQEEASKDITIGMISATRELRAPHLLELVLPARNFPKRLWERFTQHKRKNAATLSLYRIVGDRRDTLSKEEISDLAESYVRLRERCTYLDCVEGPQRWSVPETLLGRDQAVTILRGIRTVIGRIPTPAQIAGTHPTEPQALVALLNQRRLAALREWAESTEAADLSTKDLEEARDWATSVDARLH
jgi:AbiV family abortive infection protein